MSLREFQIRAARRRFLVDEEDDEFDASLYRTAKPLQSNEKLQIESDVPTMKSIVGQAAIRTGALVMMTPDPLPLVDELAAGALIVGGAYLVQSER